VNGFEQISTLVNILSNYLLTKVDMGMRYIYNTYEEGIKFDLEELPENLKNTLNGCQSQLEQEEFAQREGEGNEEDVACLLNRISNYPKNEEKDYNKLIELFKKRQQK